MIALETALDRLLNCSRLVGKTMALSYSGGRSELLAQEAAARAAVVACAAPTQVVWHRNEKPILDAEEIERACAAPARVNDDLLTRYKRIMAEILTVTATDPTYRAKIIGECATDIVHYLASRADGEPESKETKPVSTVCLCIQCGAEIDCDGLYTISDGLCGNCINGGR